MRDNMTVEEAINVEGVLACDLAPTAMRTCGSSQPPPALSVTSNNSRWILNADQARRQGIGHCRSAVPDGYRLENGTEGGGRRDFLAGLSVHAGETLYLLTYCGRHSVRYESNLRKTSRCCTCHYQEFERRSRSVFRVKRASRGRRNCGRCADRRFDLAGVD